ncbi:hypothetical protein I7I51_06753 [Histoplasma capsulatum]|uniref:Uncharacterized protein n=1 Tax=Ajellomyces capsulatus TaxID=5037 RepID=A0A8A1MMR4_AJECA|nr:hypothetical protein I7I51_06753 [Histoplasma capsulatum]
MYITLRTDLKKNLDQESVEYIPGASTDMAMSDSLWSSHMVVDLLASPQRQVMIDEAASKASPSSVIKRLNAPPAEDATGYQEPKDALLQAMVISILPRLFIRLGQKVMTALIVVTFAAHTTSRTAPSYGGTSRRGNLETTLTLWMVKVGVNLETTSTCCVEWHRFTWHADCISHCSLLGGFRSLED